MAGRGNPSFLKNQKARQRVERANAKRAARQARQAEKAASREAAKQAAENPAAPASEIEPDTSSPQLGEADPA